MRMEPSLERLNEAFDFYLKLDVAVLAGIAAILSIFKIEGEGVAFVVSEYRASLQALGWLIFSGLVFKYLVTVGRSAADALIKAPKISNGLLVVLHSGHFLQVVGHTVLFSYFLGYMSSYLEGIATRVS